MRGPKSSQRFLFLLFEYNSWFQTWHEYRAASRFNVAFTSGNRNKLQTQNRQVQIANKP